MESVIESAREYNFASTLLCTLCRSQLARVGRLFGRLISASALGWAKMGEVDGGCLVDLGEGNVG